MVVRTSPGSSRFGSEMSFLISCVFSLFWKSCPLGFDNIINVVTYNFSRQERKINEEAIILARKAKVEILWKFLNFENILRYLRGLRNYSKHHGFVGFIYRDILRDYELLG